MDSVLPFRHEHESTILSTIHPLIRFLLPFIFVVPFLLVNDIFLIFTLILSTFLISIIAKLKLSRILKRILKVLPFILLITIFLPLYIGNTVAYRLFFGITLIIYQEGIVLALLLFLRIFGAIFIFMAFMSSLTYSEFIEALTKAKVIPSFFIGSLVIMLHYLPILADSNKKILEAQELRGKKITSYWSKLKTHAYIMAKSIIINMDRSERLYESLKMRGFSGEITFSKKKLKIWDALTLLGFLLLVISFLFFLDLKAFYQEVYALFLQ
ncbi:MAG: energy-coupling factor transporter transmembrane component T family protein [Promethearchaeota archaeon]